MCVGHALRSRHLSFEEFLAAYSEAVFPLFVWNVLFYRQGHFSQLSIGDFNHVVELKRFPLADWRQAVENVRRKVKVRCQQLRRHNPRLDGLWKQTRNDLMQLGVAPQSTYLYIQGHHLMDNVVLPVVSRVCDTLVRERQNEIAQQSVHSTQRRNELSSYTNSLGDVRFLMKKNLGGMLSEPFRRLADDLERAFNSAEDASHQAAEALPSNSNSITNKT